MRDVCPPAQSATMVSEQKIILGGVGHNYGQQFMIWLPGHLGSLLKA